MITSNTSDIDNSTNSLSANTVSKYHKCATFRGVFSSKTIVVQCAKNAGGLKGNFLQIEDDHPQLEYFGLCEVDIFVERELYQCGQVEVPSYGYVLDKSSNHTKAVEYYCHEGFQLVGSKTRVCNHKTGQWKGDEPYCDRIICPEPHSIANGFYKMYGDYLNFPVTGSRIVYECKPGFLLNSANDTRICDSTGHWSTAKPHCEGSYE